MATTRATAEQIQQVQALPQHQLCLRRLAELGLGDEESMALCYDLRLSSAARRELLLAIGVERVERFRLARAMEGFAEAVDRLCLRLEGMGKPAAGVSAGPRKGGAGSPRTP